MHAHPLLTLLSVGSIVTAWRIGQDVHTTSGLVRGHEAPWPRGLGVSEYLGIPFAKPPLGNLRFAAPEKIPEGEGIVGGDKFMDDCMQPVDSAGAITDTSPEVMAYGIAMGGDPSRTYSENCLGLNVWAKPQVGEARKAVMVWLYGGGFGAGSTAADFYNGARLAGEQDVVIASVNPNIYRLGVFGFPGAPFLPDVNLGLLDQRLGLEWIRDNIADFGGDPDRITIFGESAGGASVDYYSYAWTEDPIVAGFIAQSGTAHGIPGVDFNSTYYWTLSKSLGCGDERDGGKTVECLRALPTKVLQKGQSDLGGAAGGLATLTMFGPTFDGKVVFEDVRSRAKAGKFIKKPLLVGDTDHESGLLWGLASGVMDSMAKNGGISGALAAMAKTGIEYFYSGTVGAMALTATKYMDRASTCPSHEAALARRQADVPAWRYRYMGVWDNTAIVPGMGAYHSSDCPIVFGTVQRKRGVQPNTLEEDKFVVNTMHAWATFAKDPAKGLVGLGWPMYNPQTSSLIRLGYMNQSEPNFGSNAEYNQLCGIFSTFRGS